MKFFIIIKQESERVPNKNFKLLGDKPLWRHLIDELKGENIYIDTDSSVIYNECNNIDNVTVYMRDNDFISKENDEVFIVSPVLLMINNFLDKYVEDENEIIITPHVTSPFIKKETIIKASELIGQYDSIQACKEHKEFSYFKGSAINFDPNVVQKTQDLEPIIMGNGAFFIFTKKSFKENNNNRTSSNNKFYPLSLIESIEIDYMEDFDLANIVYKNK